MTEPARAAGEQPPRGLGDAARRTVTHAGLTWRWNNDYGDLDQVTEFYPDYLAVYADLALAGKYPYNDSFKGRIPGIEGPREDTAIYLLQMLRSLCNTEITLARHREAGWRDLDPAELDRGPARFAGVAEYAIYHVGSRAAGLTVGGSGWQEWENARLTHCRSSVMVLPGRTRVNGHIVAGKLIVKD